MTERRSGRDRLVVSGQSVDGAGVITAQCAIWRPDGPLTKQVLEVLERAGARNIWLRDDVFAQVCLEQGLRQEGWPRVEFVYRTWAFIRKRSDRPPERARAWPNVFECGCSRHKVRAGLCDTFDEHGQQRGSRRLS